MSTSPNLKVNVTADTSQFQKGMKGAKEAMGTLQASVKDSATALMDMFGIPGAQVSKVLDSVGKMTKGFQGLGKEGSSAFAGVAGSVGLVGTAIAGISLGALVTQFKLLSSEAEAFRKTTAGVNAELMKTTYIEVYKQSMRDSRDLGESANSTINGMKVFFTKVGQGIKDAWLNLTTTYMDLPDIIRTTRDRMAEADEKARQGADFASQILMAEREQKKLLVESLGIDEKIAKLRQTINDKSTSAADKQKAALQVEDLIRQKYEQQIALAEKKRDAQQELNSLTTSSLADEDKLLEYQSEVARLYAQMNADIASIRRKQGGAVTIPVTIDKEQSRPDLVGEVVALSAEVEASLPKTAEILVPVGINFNKEEIVSEVTDISAMVESILNDTFNTLGDLLGGLVGDLLTGGDAWHNFANAALSAMGDMAIKVGEMAISTGITTLGIQAALDSLNGGAAIAAGVALVALGSAVRAGMSNIAAHRSAGSVSSNVASSAVLSGYSELTDIKVEVTGTLVASGSQLVAVLNNEAKRKEHTT